MLLRKILTRLGIQARKKEFDNKELNLIKEYLMRKRGSWGRKESHRTSWTTSNSSTSAQGHKGAFCVVIGRNDLGLEEGLLAIKGFFWIWIEPDREWTAGSPDCQEWQVLDLVIRWGTEADLLGTV